MTQGPVEFTVLGRPVSWKRSQRNPKTGAIYVDRESESYRAIIREAAREPMRGRVPFDCALTMSVLAIFPLPKTKPKYWIKSALAGEVPHTGVPDLDNIVKAIKDSLQSVVFSNDRLICSYAHCTKRYGEVPRLEVWIAPLTLMPTRAYQRPAEHVNLMGII